MVDVDPYRVDSANRAAAGASQFATCHALRRATLLFTFLRLPEKMIATNCSQQQHTGHPRRIVEAENALIESFLLGSLPGGANGSAICILISDVLFAIISQLRRCFSECSPVFECRDVAEILDYYDSVVRTGLSDREWKKYCPVLHLAALASDGRAMETLAGSPACDADPENELVTSWRNRDGKGKSGCSVRDRLTEPGPLGNSPAFCIAMSGDVPAMLRLNSILSEPNDERPGWLHTVNSYGQTLVSAAAQGGHTAMVECLHGLGCDLMECDKYGFSPLWRACQDGHSGTARTLIRLITCSQKITTPEGERQGIYQCDHDGYSPAFAASQNGHSDCLRALASLGCDLNMASNDGERPIHAAAEYGHLDCLIALNEAGCLNVDANMLETGEGVSLGLLAARDGHVNILKFLWSISLPGDDKFGLLTSCTSIVDDENDKPELVARAAGHTECADFLFRMRPH